VISSASNDDVNLAREAATEVPLFSVGAFDFYGKCFTDPDNGDTWAEAFIRTHEDGSILSTESFNYFGAPYLDRTTAEGERVLNSHAAGDNEGQGNSPLERNFFAAAPGGTGINGEVALAVKRGTPAAGNGIYGPGNVCIFSGFAAG
jgi:hypothetical protein